MCIKLFYQSTMNILYIIGFFSVLGVCVGEDIPEEATLDTFTLVKRHGYPCEIHKVHTEDRYILEMHRIPHAKITKGDKNKPVVLLMHGLLCSSADFVLLGPGKALAYLLADAGYDVWMGNARGNVYSRNHVTLKTTSSDFWKFSWHEIGLLDLPAMIDYALKESNSKKLQYIGFSQGTTVFWVLITMKPEYNDKVIAMQALAPVAFVSHIKSPLIQALAPFTNSVEEIFKLLGANEFLPSGIINKIAGQELCLEEAVTQILCSNIIFLLCGFSIEQMNKTMIPLIIGHGPAGSSTRQLIHYGQLYNSGEFRRYDYGWISNKINYGSIVPPGYDLTKIHTPIFLHYGDNDLLATPKDVTKLFQKLPAAVGKFKVASGEFNHLDFMFAKDADKLIYHRLLNIMHQFMIVN